MKWIIFTGTWKNTNEEVEHDVRESVREVLAHGDGIITGGALGVDLFCMDEVLKINLTCTHLRVILPSKLDLYLEHYAKRITENIITKEKYEELEKTLQAIQKINPSALVEMHFTKIDSESYAERDNEEVKYGDGVHAFQVNDSNGTQHTIDSALIKGIPLLLHKKYSIKE
ncbi:TPA: hypothetical protein DEP94_01920 [Candidatus Nomurabacteria bacterium]|nr:hypothetical protein [Candidatus Nomurabacteria bacterium]